MRWGRLPVTEVRPIRTVPWPIGFLLAAAILGQIVWHGLRPQPLAQVRLLRPPPEIGVLRVASLGDPEGLARVLNLWLQFFDVQPGLSVPFRELDYGSVIPWLERILALDPRGQYPLLAASRLYAEVPVESKQRQMLEFVYRAFLDDPNRRWPWLAHAVYVARYRLHDARLALRYAEAIAEQATGPAVPSWAQQLRIFVLEGLGEIEAAKVLLGGLIESGTIRDPHELRWLERRLRDLEARQPGGAKH